MKYMHADNSYDQIRSYVLGTVDALSPELETLRRRWVSAFTCMLDPGLKSDRQVCKKLVDLYEISEDTAYRDIAASKRLFGDARKSSKEIERYLASENAKENYDKAWTMFLATRKYQWFLAAVFQQKIHAKVNGLDKDDPDLPDPSRINPPIQILQINFDFLTSQFAQVIDPKAKVKINAILDQIRELVEQNRIGDYLNTTIDIPHIDSK